ncbi:Protein of unknown function DUF1645, plant [Dillenia turbinata]|uniref:Uncharacterized protein n=1 Tax=Dillenia turbinata TaxID=194707 RepID=A0AAN8ZP81_9MAGN
MVLENPNNGDETKQDLHAVDNGVSEEIDSTCSTPYVSAPSSPGRSHSGYYFSAPASPMHFVLLSSAATTCSLSSPTDSNHSASKSGSLEFEFSSQFSNADCSESGSMISADELFLNGQIRPMKLSSHLQTPQILAPLLDLEAEDEEEGEEIVMRGRDLRLRSRSMHRKTRSMSPLRNEPFQRRNDVVLKEQKQITEAAETTPSDESASSSRSSSSGRNSKKWIFLKDLLYRSKSEGRANSRDKFDKFWSSFSPKLEALKQKKTQEQQQQPKEEKEKESEREKDKDKVATEKEKKKKKKKKPMNGVGKRKVQRSPHELHYTANREKAEELKKKTFLPYRQGLLGCLGFSSKSYGALNGLTSGLNPVSSRS